MDSLMDSIDLSDLIVQVLLALSGVMVVLAVIVSVLNHRLSQREDGGDDRVLGEADQPTQLRVAGAASTVTTGLRTVTRVSGGSRPSSRR